MKSLKKITVRDMAEIAIVSALYVVFTIVVAPIAYNELQFRISEILMLLCFFNRKHTISLVLGCFIANLWSPYLLWDMIFGTSATLIACLLMSRTKKLIVASLWPVLTNGIIVGAEIAILSKINFFVASASVAFGEFVVVTIFGTIIFSLISKNDYLKKNILDFEKE